MKTTIKAAFKDLKVNTKGEVTIVLGVKGELKDAQILALHRLKTSGAVFAELFDGQTDIDDYEHDDESEAEPQRVTYKLNNGNVEVDPDQLAFDDVIKNDDDDKCDGDKAVDAVDFDKEGQEPAEDHARQLNWLEQEEKIAEEEIKKIEANQALSDELE